MFCSNCGNRLSDGAAFCDQCGAKTVNNESAQQAAEIQQPQKPENVNTVVPESENSAPVQAEISVVNETAVPSYPYYSTETQPAEPQYSMKWFKFLIYFSLFFAAFINFTSQGLFYLTGAVYTMADTDPDLVYLFYDGLKVADVAFGIAGILLAVFSIFTRFRLAKFKKDGPICYYILQASSAVVSLLYGIAASVITGESMSGMVDVFSIVLSAILIAANVKYFSKRKALFVN